MSNPATSASGGSGEFYNNDGEYHTYRFSVTSDNRIFVYRDGLAVDTMRIADLAMQPEFAVSDGDYVENLLRNGSFEVEWNYSNSLVRKIDGWNVYPLDQSNSDQSIVPLQIINEQDYTTHAITM